MASGLGGMISGAVNGMNEFYEPGAGSSFTDYVDHFGQAVNMQSSWNTFEQGEVSMEMGELMQEYEQNGDTWSSQDDYDR